MRLRSSARPEAGEGRRFIAMQDLKSQCPIEPERMVLAAAHVMTVDEFKSRVTVEAYPSANKAA